MAHEIPVVDPLGTQGEKSTKIGKVKEGNAFPFDDLLKPGMEQPEIQKTVGKINPLNLMQSLKRDQNGEKIPLKAKPIVKRSDLIKRAELEAANQAAGEEETLAKTDQESAAKHVGKADLANEVKPTPKDPKEELLKKDDKFSPESGVESQLVLANSNSAVKNKELKSKPVDINNQPKPTENIPYDSEDSLKKVDLIAANPAEQTTEERRSAQQQAIVENVTRKENSEAISAQNIVKRELLSIQEVLNLSQLKPQGQSKIEVPIHRLGEKGIDKTNDRIVADAKAVSPQTDRTEGRSQHAVDKQIHLKTAAETIGSEQIQAHKPENQTPIPIGSQMSAESMNSEQMRGSQREISKPDVVKNGEIQKNKIHAKVADIPQKPIEANRESLLEEKRPETITTNSRVMAEEYAVKQEKVTPLAKMDTIVTSAQRDYSPEKLERVDSPKQSEPLKIKASKDGNDIHRVPGKMTSPLQSGQINPSESAKVAAVNRGVESAKAEVQMSEKPTQTMELPKMSSELQNEAIQTATKFASEPLITAVNSATNEKVDLKLGGTKEKDKKSNFVSATQHLRSSRSSHINDNYGVQTLIQNDMKPSEDNPADVLKQQLRDRIDILKKAQQSIPVSQDSLPNQNMHNNMSMKATPEAGFIQGQTSTIPHPRANAPLFARSFAAEMVAKIRDMTFESAADGKGQKASFIVDGGPMGELDIEFHQESSREQITIFVDNDLTKSEMQRVLPHIEDNMNQRGLNFSNVNVEVKDDQKNSESMSDGRSKHSHSHEKAVPLDQVATEENKANTKRNYGYNTMEVLA